VPISGAAATGRQHVSAASGRAVKPLANLFYKVGFSNGFAMLASIPRDPALAVVVPVVADHLGRSPHEGGPANAGNPSAARRRCDASIRDSSCAHNAGMDALNV